jgi:hypothetical protein
VIDDTRLRFLKSIVAQLEVERIAEVHLFPAIRQGGMESGVAVLALEPVRELASVGAATDDAVADVQAPSDVAAEAPADSAPSDSASADEAEHTANPDDVESPYAETDAADDDASGDEDDVDVESEDADLVVEPRRAPRRFTVYTARYRHTLKGPDRGKWEVSVTEEADAPLLTVDAVVRGVQRRSGDLDEIVRMSGTEVIALTAAPSSSP